MTAARPFIGLISDTHGLVRPEALAALAGATRILHAGDVGGAAVIGALERVAPTTVVRGNNDFDAWGCTLPEAALVDVGGAFAYVLHQRNLLDIDPPAAGVGVVVTGHSHRPEVASEDGVLFVNPGSAGPRRFRLPVSVARLFVEPAEAAGAPPRLHAELVILAP